jgi:alcohol dehydrogenase class IV
MPDPFKLQLGSEIIFGGGRLHVLGEETSARLGPGARLLLVADPALAKSADKAVTALAAAGHQVARFDRLTSDPRADQIDEAADQARTFGADGIVGLGGGSALDVAKMTAAVTPGSFAAREPVQDSGSHHLGNRSRGDALGGLQQRRGHQAVGRCRLPAAGLSAAGSRADRRDAGLSDR